MSTLGEDPRYAVAKDFDISTDTVYLHLERLKGSNATVQPFKPRLPPYCWSGSRISSLKSSRFPVRRPSAVPPISRVRFFQLFRHFCKQAGIPAHLLHPPLPEARTRHTRNPYDWDTAHSAIPWSRQYTQYTAVSSQQ